MRSNLPIASRVVTILALLITLIAVVGPASAAHLDTTGSSCNRWARVPSPTPGEGGNLYDVAWASPGRAWAVGKWQDPSGVVNTLIEGWDGSSWTLEDSPNPNALDNELFGVDAISITDAWAVGLTSSDDFLSLPLAEHWDGSSWASVEVPAYAGTDYTLLDVGAASPTDVWAVGFFRPLGDLSYGLIDHWDGTKWSIAGVPLVEKRTVLSGVTVISSSDVWAVGNSYPLDGPNHTLTMHWDGSQWTVVPSPSPGDSSSLSGIDAVGPNDVWAVGSSDGGSLAVHWDGAEWTSVPPGSVAVLTDVAAPGADDVWAVGWRVGNQGNRTVTIRWDGNAWIPARSIGANGAAFNGVAAFSPTRMWAVGFVGINTLIARFVRGCGVGAAAAGTSNGSGMRTVSDSSGAAGALTRNIT
jgi:hypothetical protein